MGANKSKVTPMLGSEEAKGEAASGSHRQQSRRRIFRSFTLRMKKRPTENENATGEEDANTTSKVSSIGAFELIGNDEDDGLREEPEEAMLHQATFPSSSASEAAAIAPAPAEEMENEDDIVNGSEELPPMCDVCRQSATSENPLVSCSSCKIFVHKPCFIVEDVAPGPGGDGWLCPPCNRGLNPAELSCSFCPDKGGALKPIVDTNYGSWGHMSCAFWIPEVDLVKSEDGTEEAISVQDVPMQWYNRICSICYSVSETGICIPCQCNFDEGKCGNVFHVMCAIKNGLEMRRTLMADGSFSIVCLCKRHSHKNGQPQQASKND